MNAAAELQLDDPLARALWAAREAATETSPGPDWAGLTLDRARQINEQLFGRLDGDGAEPPGSSARSTQPRNRRLGLSEPLVCRVLPDRLHVGAGEVRLDLARLVRPKFEPEIGIRVQGESLRLVACVEVADCRFVDWQLPPCAAIADFGLQGEMIFGSDTVPIKDVHVSVRRDGVEQAAAVGSWSDAVEKLALLPPARPDEFLVATGALTPLLDATPGRWEFDFRDVGRLTVVVT